MRAKKDSDTAVAERKSTGKKNVAASYNKYKKFNGEQYTGMAVGRSHKWYYDKGEWKDKTQWHNVLAFGQGFAQIASRLLKGTHVFVQGELSTREYHRTITIPKGKKSVEHVIQQFAVELKADTIRILDRTANSENAGVAQAAADEDVPL